MTGFTTDEARAEYVRSVIRDVEDFPQKGITFRDITPVLLDPQAFACSLDLLEGFCADRNPTRLVGIEARGFILAAPLAARMGLGLVPVRKPGKLPWETVSQSYELEYGTDELEVHTDGFGPADRVVIVDDLLATGGTARATCKLVESLGATVVGVVGLIDLAFLPWRKKLEDYDVRGFIRYE